MILESLLVFVPALLSGLILICLLFPGNLLSNFPLKCSLAAPVGLGISSCLYFFWCWFLGPQSTGFTTIEWILIIILLAALLFFKRNSFSRPIWNQTPDRKMMLLYGIPGLLFFILLVLTLMAYKNYTFMFPHGTFDAYAIWNLKARFIFRDAENWQNAFSPQLNWKFHADYPLLLSLNVARAWLALGVESTRVPILLSAIFFLSTLSLTYFALMSLRDASQAVTGATLLLAAPWLMFYATTLNAAIPTAFFYLAACIMMLLFNNTGKVNYLVLAGLLSGLSAWTKNEGQVFLLAACVSFLIFLPKKPFKKYGRQLLFFLSGLALPLITLVVFKVCLAPPNDLLGNQSLSEFLPKLIDIERYRLIIRAFSGIILHMGEWNSPVILIALAYGIITGIQSKKTMRMTYTAALAVLITFLGYSAVYLITPHPLEWHLKYSADRLLFHLFPAFLFIIFYISKTPVELIKSTKKEQT